jgi:hypothetical protein
LLTYAALSPAPIEDSGRATQTIARNLLAAAAKTGLQTLARFARNIKAVSPNDLSVSLMRGGDRRNSTIAPSSRTGC